MNSQTKLTIAKLRRMLLVTTLVICPLLSSVTGNAQVVTANFAQTGTGLTTFNIMPNSTFQLTLNITTNFPSSGITYFLQTGANGFPPLAFRITARNVTGAIYPDLTTDDGTAFIPPAGDLNPVNDFDLGATNQGVNITPPGTYFIATLTIQTLNLTVGQQYTIFLDNRTIVTDRTGGGFNDVNITGLRTVTLNVIPEPSTIGLAVLGGAVLLVVAWRKQRALA